MKTSQTIVKIAEALNKAQSEIGAAKKDSSNPFFKSKYADLGSIMEVCKEPLNKNGISVLQTVGFTQLLEGGMAQHVETTLLHTSGEFLSDQMIITVAKDHDPQAQGSAISYAKRYSLQSMLFIPAEDDDGEKAMVRPQPQVSGGLNMPCKIHGVSMTERIGRDGTPYFSHLLETGKLCYGR